MVNLLEEAGEKESRHN